MSQALLYYVHLCQRGEDDVIEDPNYLGTSKSSEGYAAEKAFGQAAEDGMHIEVNWQDGDSSSEIGFHKGYPDKSKSKVMLCAGHVGRAHGKQLDTLGGMKQFNEGFKSKHRKKYPAVDSVKCNCHGKKHSKQCGCMSDNFQRAARINHSFAILEAHNAKDPSKYVEIMHTLGDYHCKDIHKWQDGQCNFHPHVVCSCGKCDDKDTIQCAGKPYTSKNTLTCPLHQQAYKVECYQRASLADRIIHSDFGKGHSNLPETDHAIFAKFRSKDLNIQRLHYIVSTNFALMQSNMAWLMQQRGPDYHWIIDLYNRLFIPVPEDLIEICHKAVETAESERKRRKSDHSKQVRIQMKQARVQASEDRKRWVKEQKTQHTYGTDEHNDDDGSIIMEPDSRVDKDAESLLEDNVIGNTCIITSQTGPKTGKKKKI